MFEKYLSTYGGVTDWYLQSFNLLKENFFPNNILYAGSWIHITPSLVFPRVVYVDMFSKMEQFFTNPEVIMYVTKNATSKNKPELVFHQSDYNKDFGEEKNSFDLLISLNSGFVSQACSSYLKKDGLLLVNNEHFDAIRAYVDPQFKAIGIFKKSNKLIETKTEVETYFITTQGSSITLEMVEENKKRSPSKAKFKLKKKAHLYLFQKNG
ncbi:MAG: hypothetical protein OQK81_00935 [Candidatus Bathyarchaeota archaeon]|nr:hypothetical protein [Candidatus Bathyarchaeota archaeon]